MADEKLFAYLSYQNAPKALEWLRSIGFEEVRRQDGDDGSIVHAEIRLGAIVLMVASNDAGYQHPPLINRSTGSGLYLLVHDVDTVYNKAIEAGARAVFEPESTEWGTRRARILDPEGYEWSFGSYEPGQSW